MCHAFERGNQFVEISCCCDIALNEKPARMHPDWKLMRRCVPAPPRHQSRKMPTFSTTTDLSAACASAVACGKCYWIGYFFSDDANHGRVFIRCQPVNVIGRGNLVLAPHCDDFREARALAVFMTDIAAEPDCASKATPPAFSSFGWPGRIQGYLIVDVDQGPCSWGHARPWCQTRLHELPRKSRSSVGGRESVGENDRSFHADCVAVLSDVSVDAACGNSKNGKINVGRQFVR